MRRIENDEDLKIAFESEHQITGGSIAVKNPSVFENWLQQFGGINILGADAKDEKIAISGWLEELTKN